MIFLPCACHLCYTSELRLTRPHEPRTAYLYGGCRSPCYRRTFNRRGYIVTTLRDLTKEPPFGRLTVIERGPNNKHGHVQWLCECICGTRKLIPANHLTSGNSQSCGCLQRELSIQRFTTHGRRHTAEYTIWHHMKRRCLDPKNKAYARYGGRGITICERWLEFAYFYEDMGPRPSAKHSIERRNNNLGYSPNNCYWATPTEQGRNKRNNRLVTIDGHTACVAEWIHIKGLRTKTIYARIEDGWSYEQALTIPVRFYRPRRPKS